MKNYLSFINIKKRGFSIIEMITAVAIISIFISISYVGWKRYIKQAIFTEAKTNLSLIFASQSQYKATCGHYHPDLRAIGAIPVGKLRYNMGATYSATSWGKCLTETDPTCSDCKTHFDEICCSEADFEDIDKSCPCYIKENYKVDKSIMHSAPHTAQNYCGITKGVTKDKFCILAVTAINRDRTTPSQWDVWVVNHLNIIKQVSSPGD